MLGGSYMRTDGLFVTSSVVLVVDCDIGAASG